MKNKEEGSTLIEVIISLLMVAVLLVLYASALTTVAQTRKLRYENIAYHVAAKKVEDLRNTSYANLAYGDVVIVDPLLNQIPSGAGTYNVAAYPTMNQIKEITVTVSWNDGKAKQIVLKTLSGSGGLNP